MNIEQKESRTVEKGQWKADIRQKMIVKRFL